MDSNPGATVEVQVFTTHGTWIKPAGARYIDITLIGSGGGGGSGASDLHGTRCFGGGGGNGGGYSRFFMGADILPETVGVRVHAGGRGARGTMVDELLGKEGEGGSPSSFVAGELVLQGAGGAGGRAGRNLAIPALPVAEGNMPNDITAGPTSAWAGNEPTLPRPGTAYYTCPGGGGGGLNEHDEPGFGGRGGNPLAYTAFYSPQTNGGGAPDSSPNGIDGENRFDVLLPGRGGGGGGAQNLKRGSIAGNGGNGGHFGAGGGGGGASRIGSPSGAGGNGGNGLVVVMTFF